jgi:hypothetical protein
MTRQPRQEPFKQAPRGTILIEQYLTSSPLASPPDEGPCLYGEGLQEQLQRLQQCVCDLLIKNQQLRMSLESMNQPSLAPLYRETHH